MAKTYELLKWTDDIIDHVAGIILEEGMPVNARNLNHMDKGIGDAHTFVAELQSAVKRLQVQMELGGRAPGANGTFSDTLDGTKTTLDTTKSAVKTAVSIGATSIEVEDATGFTALSQVTIYDGTKREDVMITKVAGNVLTVQALKNGYSKGATVARSTVAVDTANKIMLIAPHVVYDVALIEMEGI